MSNVRDEDWTPQTLPTWRHSNWVGVWDPWIVVFKGPRVWYSVIREIVTIERMHRAFARGLMEYGMIRGHKTGSGSSHNSSSHASSNRRGLAGNGKSGLAQLEGSSSVSSSFAS